MRYPASEKLEIIRTVEGSHLPAKQTLDMLAFRAPHSTDGMTATSKVALMPWRIVHLAQSLSGTVFRRPGGMI